MNPARTTAAPSAEHRVVLVTGISGSGKSVALHALEDAGFFCVDNLPPELLRDFMRVERLRSGRIRRIAIAVDVRSAGSLPHLLPLIDELRGEGIAIQSFFLDASTDALLSRFSETRRPHPLTTEAGGGDAQRALIDAHRAGAQVAGRVARSLHRHRHQPVAAGPIAPVGAPGGGCSARPA